MTPDTLAAFALADALMPIPILAACIGALALILNAVRP